MDAEDPLEDVDGNNEYLVFVDYDFPESLHDKLDWPPPARLCVQEHDVGPYTQLSVKGKSSVEKLVPYLGLHEMEGIHSKRLAFLRNQLGARVWKVHRAYGFLCLRVLEDFMLEAYADRRRLKEEGRAVEQGFVKLCINSIYGKTVQNQENYYNSTHYFDAKSFSKAQACARVADFTTEIMEPDAFMGTVRRVCEAKKNVNRSPLQLGWGVLELSKLALAVQYWMGVKSALPRVVPIFTDTDSMLVEIIGDCSPVKLLAEANLKLPVEFDLVADLDPEEFKHIHAGEISAEASRKLERIRGKLGALSDECCKWTILDVVCLAVKKYSILLSDGNEIHKAKGVPKTIRSNAKHVDYVKVHEENSTSYGSFTQMRSSQHQVFIVSQNKKTFNVMNDKAFQLTKLYCRPMGHWRNAYLGVWLRLGGDDVLFQMIMEFVRGVPPAMKPEWGSLLRSL